MIWREWKLQFSWRDLGIGIYVGPWERDRRTKYMVQRTFINLLPCVALVLHRWGY